MEKSDLDSFQDIIVTSDNPDSATIAPLGSSPRSTLYKPVTCQICGVLLKLDNNLLHMHDNTYRQLSSALNGGGSNCRGLLDDLDTTLNANLDAEMEASLSALVSDSVGVQASGTTTNAGDDDLVDIHDKDKILYEPMYRKSTVPPPPHLFPETNASSSSSNSNHQELMIGWSDRINAISALFDIMSSNTPIDHPLCEECADQLVNQLDSQCKVVEKEHADYTALINRLNQQLNSEAEVAKLEKELKELDQEERELVEMIETAEKQESELIQKRQELEAEESKLMQQEQQCLLEYSNYKRQLIKLEEKQESLDNQIRNAKFHFNRLRTVNPLNAAFHIWHSGPFGTINYFRLGRMPGVLVEYEEINAGLGQANLLLYTLAKWVKLEFKRYRLVPYGSFSYIEVIENTNGLKVGDELNMYRAKSYKYFFDWDKKFEKGLAAFLDCLKQLEEKIKSIDGQFNMPYRINGHKLEDKNGSSYSIKFQLNSFEEWTKAFKYMLTNLKWSLAWVTSMQGYNA